MNEYLATIVAQERLRDRMNEAATRRLLTEQERTTAPRIDVTVSDIMLAVSRRLVLASNRLRSAGEQQYTVHACCVA